MKAIISMEPLGFGFRRLSIIDLAGGHQPMSDQEETVWVVFNGEIYNFHELRRELQSFGHVFRTNSRYRGHHSWLQAMGRRGAQSPQWHVRAGHLGRTEKEVGYRARSVRDQADLLQNR